ncbi:DUF4165 domain-containing protein [Neiella marina]|uniref:DUF4165 domain-containing protein n=1 Tax=Neiella holothuriorum TaxID=2870530 RepID=A0ABS7EHN6_9GAMM|nr:Ig-like domain-containing protein [Neiella holothuriorum]MBW8191408.1 DUF4165 domain-containing protein [Neiella holothuriorum]
MKLLRFAPFIVAANLLALSTTVHADVEGYQFVQAHSATTIARDARSTSGSRYKVSPDAGGVQIYVSGGLDRKLELTIAQDTDGVDVHHESSSVISTADRLSLNGRDFYGKKFTVKGLPDGAYTLTAETLAASGELIATETIPLHIDTVLPTVGEITWTGNGAYHFNHDDGIQIVSRYYSYRMILNDIDDPLSNNYRTNIRYGTFKSYYADGPNAGQLARSKNLIVDLANTLAFAGTGERDGVGDDYFPTNENAKYRVEMSICDWASNCTTVEKYYYVANKATAQQPELLGVFTGSGAGVGEFAGFEPFTSGMAIDTNPAKLLYRFNRNGYKNLGNALDNEANIYGGWIAGSETSKTQGYWDATDDDYLYKVIETTVTTEGTLSSDIYIQDHVAWRRYFFPADLTFGTAEATPPKFLSIEFFWDHNQSWINSFMTTSSTTGGVSSTLSKLRATVEPRPYSQRLPWTQGITAGDECIIPPNETTCELDISLPYPEVGSTGVYHSRPVIRSDDNGMRSNESTYVLGWDGLPATLSGHRYIGSHYGVWIMDYQPTKIWSNHGVHNIELVFTGEGGEEVVVEPYIIEAITMDSATSEYRALFPKANLPEGIWQLSTRVEDGPNPSYDYHSSENNFNQEFLLLDAITIDSTAPIVTITNDGNASFDSIVGLESLRIDVQDSSDYSAGNITLSGGPSNDSVVLPLIHLFEHTYAVDYPRIFPSLVEGDTYTLSATFRDINSLTTTTTASFSYIPPNMVDLEPQSVLAINQPLELPNGDPLATIATDSLRTEEGNLARGEQTLMFTLRTDSEFAVVIDGLTVSPGQTVEMLVAVDPLTGAINLPVYPAQSGMTGTANFMVEIPVIEGVWCNDDFELNNGQCEQTLTLPAIWSCDHLAGHVLNNSQCTTTLRVERERCSGDQVYDESQDMCFYSATYDADPSCSSGSLDSSDNLCHYTRTYTSSSYDCPDGYYNSSPYTPGVSRCVKIVSGECNVDGYKLAYIGGCEARSISIADDEECPAEYPYRTDNSGYPFLLDKCKAAAETYIQRTCPSGYEPQDDDDLYFEMCYHKTDYTSQIVDCGDGDYNSSTGKCSEPATKSPTWNCDDGDSLDGQECIKEEIATPLPAECGNDWTVFPTYCTLDVSVPAQRICTDSDYSYNGGSDQCEDVIVEPILE